MESANRITLGVEGGGTKTDWVLLDGAGGVLREGQLHAANLKLSTDDYLTQLFSVLPYEAENVGVFLAGCATAQDRERLRRLVAAAWPGARVVVGSDRESGFATALGDGDGIVVVSGTGAVVHGRRGGHVEKAGGWGQILGDRGGGYDVARRALRKIMLHHDLDGTISPLASAILAALGLNELSQLVDWIHTTDKMGVARLAPVIFRAAKEGDAEMHQLLEHRAKDLAEFTHAVAERLGMLSEPVEVRLIGSLLTKEPMYAGMYRTALRHMLPEANVALCTKSGAFGAAALAGREVAEEKFVRVELHEAARSELAHAGTEQRHSRSAELDKMGVPELVAVFIAEEECVQRALAAQAAQLAAAVEIIVKALGAGGRLFHVGAGTSGRLGVLDASEMPPTFGTSPEMIQGIIAGGAPALLKSAESAEDSPDAGALAMLGRGVRAGDVVCGIAASGRTPFVIGALTHARIAGARTLLLTCNPSRIPSPAPWDVEMDFPTGPELITGSTRLKAGTATKAALNILTTCAMIRLGKARGGEMTNLRPANAKLRDRATRIVATAREIETDAARALLEKHDWDISAALAQLPLP